MRIPQQTSANGPIRRALAGALCACAMGPASASLVYGTLSNFDVYNNDDGVEYHGFEIEFEDISSTDIGFTYPNAHYGSGQKTQAGTTARLRYAASFDSSTQSWSGTTFTHPVGAPVSTSGHACINLAGCEHFGAGLYRNPTATRYHWLMEDANAPGTLIPGPAVSLLAPIWTVAPNPNPGNPPVVEFVAPVPEFEQEAEDEKFYPDAVWVKITKIELEDEVPLADLLSDNDALFNNPNVNVEVETEWELIEKGGNPAEKAGQAQDGAKQIVRRFETYQYIGPVTLENEPDCDLVSCDVPVPDETLGALIGANIAAVNLEQIEAPNPVPVPAALPLLISALAGLAYRRRRA